MSNAEESIVLILVGLVGSGKSTFATALERHFPDKWRRCNQDELGSRLHVESLARDSLYAGFSVCIDRTNIDARQRAHWVKIANEFPGTFVWVIVFSTPYEVCASRLEYRSSHPTIHTPEQALSVLSRFSSGFQPPVADEGFHRILSLQPSDTPLNYTAVDILSILERIRSSPGHSKPPRVSWVERRRQTRPNGGRPYANRGRGGGRNVNPETSHEDRRVPPSGYLRRAWEQDTSGQSNPDSSRLTQELKILPESKPANGSDFQDGNEPFPLSRDLLDSLGVD
ncbi:hypothetical protein D9757_010020 [Collybiopsis confluens]|uniref:P-loop containing nucleoside triphosphate hydrolase protein n=1 Tax=Collybiopsis confluens TaxID=2823264 RepID=A0A8H5LTQ8_9AGAR|nr:hypothetical protein D9757_010020 [Collybiopsis confluens]